MIENVSPKKFLGQHFLIDENISKKIVNSVILKEFDKIVEIGPGKGALTKYLLQYSDKLILIEYDAESFEFIKSSFKKHNPNIIYKNNDVAETVGDMPIFAERTQQRIPKLL